MSESHWKIDYFRNLVHHASVLIVSRLGDESMKKGLLVIAVVIAGCSMTNERVANAPSFITGCMAESSKEAYKKISEAMKSCYYSSSMSGLQEYESSEGESYTFVANRTGLKTSHSDYYSPGHAQYDKNGQYTHDTQDELKRVETITPFYHDMATLLVQPADPKQGTSCKAKYSVKFHRPSKANTAIKKYLTNNDFSKLPDC